MRPDLVEVRLDLDRLAVQFRMLVHDDADEVAVIDDELLAQVAEANGLLSHGDPFYYVAAPFARHDRPSATLSGARRRSGRNLALPVPGWRC